MNKIKTYVAIVLDKSSSMHRLSHKAIEDFNSQIETMKKKVQEDPNLDIYVTLVLFDHNVGIVYRNNPLNDVVPLTNEEYVPSGSTALYSAIGTAINTVISKVVLPTDAAFIVTITDGQENSSKEDDKRCVPLRIKELEADGRWTFSYLGAVSSVRDFNNLGSHAGNTLSVLEELGNNTTSAMHNNYFNERSRGATQSYNTYTGSKGADEDVHM